MTMANRFLRLLLAPVRRLHIQLARQSPFLSHLRFLVNAAPTPGVYSTMRDGSAFRDALNLLQPGEKLLPVHIYFDDATPASSLGYKSSAYQMAYFHLTVAALPSHLTAGLRFKYPLTIAHSKDVASFNFTPVYNYIVSEFKKLATIDMEWKGRTYTMRLVLISILGDNKGMHEFSGLSTSFSSGSICRWCPALYHDMHHCLRACTLSLRSKDEYDDVIASGNELMMEHHGIKFSCLLNSLPGFHTTLSSPPDFFHDVLEGVSRKEVHRLQQFLSRRGLSRENLNERLARHDYGRTDDSNRPSALSQPTGTTIGNKANQSWVLIRYLLVIAEDYGDVNSPEWVHFRLFALLVESITKTSYTDVEVDKLEEDIEEWLGSYVTLYGAEEMVSSNGRFKSSITSKHHFLLHYPHHVRTFGPLIHLSTFTYEQMHLAGKAKSYITKCFINLPLTISNTYALVCAERRSRPYLEVTPSK
ncbi:hypothetical protein PFISCL1PPCAC_21012, partial [Pristionchus fissidentatus]